MSDKPLNPMAIIRKLQLPFRWTHAIGTSAAWRSTRAEVRRGVPEPQPEAEAEAEAGAGKRVGVQELQEILIRFNNDLLAVENFVRNKNANLLPLVPILNLFVGELPTAFDANAAASNMRTLEAELSEAGESEPAAVANTSPTEPRKLLTGWHDITAALDMKYDDRRTIASLNERFDGPITNKGRGTKPTVYRDALLEWWNKLAIEHQEQQNVRDGERLSAEVKHDYGRDGTVFPELNASKKKRT